MSSVNERRMNSRAVDKLGIVASTACAVHCGVSAFVPALLGALGVGALLGHEAEWVFTLVAVAFASIALWLGFRRHRSRRVASILLTGIFGLLAARVIEVGAADHHDSGDHREAYAASKVTPSHAQGHDDTHGHGHGAAHGHGHGNAGSWGWIGTLVGVFAGCLLLVGHLVNTCACRRCQESDVGGIAA
jgi:hypothetical protein